MKAKDLKKLIREEIQKVLNENTIKVTPITDFPYLSKKNPNNKAVKVDLSKDQINLSKSIKPVFVVVKNFDEQYNKFYYVIYYQPSDSINSNYWEQGSSTPRQSGKGQLQSLLVKKLINVARPKLK
jgi:hypothetical protein